MQRAIIIILVVLVSLPVFLKSRESRIKSAPAAFSVVSSDIVIVRVSGDVRHSGIYEVNANTLTINVINMAIVDGTVKYPEPGEVGLRHVVNGTDLHLGKKHDGTAIISVGQIPAGERMILGIPLDINSMSEADFDRLPGIGPAMARRIIEYRQNNGGRMRVEDLPAVEGVGEMTYQKLCKYF
jgi:competence protein ComEA